MDRIQNVQFFTLNLLPILDRKNHQFLNEKDDPFFIEKYDQFLIKKDDQLLIKKYLLLAFALL